jgi:hypothetical protein
LAAADQNAEFFQKFVTLNPQYERLMFGAESHGGLYVPLFFQSLVKKNYKSVLDKISHVSLGNPRFSCTPDVKSPWDSSYVKSIR